MRPGEATVLLRQGPHRVFHRGAEAHWPSVPKLFSSPPLGSKAMTRPTAVGLGVFSTQAACPVRPGGNHVVDDEAATKVVCGPIAALKCCWKEGHRQAEAVKSRDGDAQQPCSAAVTTRSHRQARQRPERHPSRPLSRPGWCAGAPKPLTRAPRGLSSPTHSCSQQPPPAYRRGRCAPMAPGRPSTPRLATVARPSRPAERRIEPAVRAHGGDKHPVPIWSRCSSGQRGPAHPRRRCGGVDGEVPALVGELFEPPCRKRRLGRSSA